VVIVSYNSRRVLEPCLKWLKERLKENELQEQTEIIVVDNNSQIAEQQWLKTLSGVKLIESNSNLGFGRANNLGLEVASGKYVLFLNSDVNLEEPIDFAELMAFLEKTSLAAGLTIRLLLPNGRIDPASHRGFPTPGNSLAYFLGLEKLTAGIWGLNRFFGGYHLSYLPLNTVHEIDSPTAAFFLLKKSVLAKVGGFDPDYFFYGEDLDLSYRIKKLGFSLWYYPRYRATHLKYQSSQASGSAKIRRESRNYFFETMELFVDKHYAAKYPRPLVTLMKLGIRLLGKLRK
jgi:GT2 family glycosyltransferase